MRIRESGRGRSPAPTRLPETAPTGRRGRRPLRRVCGRRGVGTPPYEGENGANTGVPTDNPSVARWATAPFAQGSLWPAGAGGGGLPRQPVGPPRNDKNFLSFRGAKRRGNSFLSRQGSVPHTAAEVLLFPRQAATTQAALSEAGSAEREAGQFGLCPMREECSTAWRVRRSDRHPARGYAGAFPN